MAAPEMAHVSAEEVARAGLDAVERNQPLVIPGFLMKLGMFFVRLAPLSILRLASRITAKRDR
jgi:short-subunit dehydrogenase